MKICVYGAGAIGGHVGALLANQADNHNLEVSLIARGPHLAAIQENGLTLVEGGNRLQVRPKATSDPKELGPQDYVIIGLKAHSVPAVVPLLQPLLGPDTTVITTANGVPWWYFYGHGGDLDGSRLGSVDPGDVQWQGIGPERVIGSIAWQAAEIAAPGVVEVKYGNRMPLGEPDGSRTDRVEKLAGLLNRAGLKTPVRLDIRREIWMKLWGNLSFNPISILTGATLDVIAQDPRTRRLVVTMMEEAGAIAKSLGLRLPMGAEKRVDMAADVGSHKTSMLQDLELNRAIELDALVGAVIELGRLTEVATPAIETIYALARQRAEMAGCYVAPEAGS